MNEPSISFGKATVYLEALLAGKGQKEAAYLAGLKYPKPAMIKAMFPLFLGLKRDYNRKESTHD